MTKKEIQSLHERSVMVERMPCRVYGIEQFPRVVIQMSLTEGRAATLVQALADMSKAGNATARDLHHMIVNAALESGIEL